MGITGVTACVIKMPSSPTTTLLNRCLKLSGEPTYGTAQGPHMSCSYADLALTFYDSKALPFDLSPTTWKSFQDDVFVVWTHGSVCVSLFLEYLSTIDKTGKSSLQCRPPGMMDWSF